jgi:hypothetical protein
MRQLRDRMISHASGPAEKTDKRPDSRRMDCREIPILCLCRGPKIGGDSIEVAVETGRAWLGGKREKGLKQAETRIKVC